jgi:hypothetical protein
MTHDKELEDQMRSLFQRTPTDAPSEIGLDEVLRGGHRRLRRRIALTTLTAVAGVAAATGATISVVNASPGGTTPPPASDTSITDTRPTDAVAGAAQQPGAVAGAARQHTPIPEFSVMATARP